MSNSLSILIVDDEPSVRNSLNNWFLEDGYITEVAEDAEKALLILEKQTYDIILVDIKMPGMDGLELHRRIKNLHPETVVIIMTAFAAVDTAIEALKNGAYDYVCKPFDPDALSHLIRNVSRQIELKSENVTLRERISKLENVDNFIGSSLPMKELFKQISDVSRTDSTVIITGESGTGKELVANAIHVNSSRKFFPLITVHCGAVADTLLEDELFGHERGAFTGAQYARKGKFELANNGTIFLDEIATISSKMQVELLRVLESKSFTRVGGTKELKSDFRVICATNRDLKSMVKTGEFREDLFYRLNVFSIEVPPLRERMEDIPELISYFSKKHARLMNTKEPKFDKSAMNLLVNYHYPGNVRELENIVERAIVIGRGDTVKGSQLPISPTFIVPKDDKLSNVEKHHIISVLNKYEWNISQAAKALDIDRVTLYNKINKYNLKEQKRSK